jgi:hypothetical protein
MRTHGPLLQVRRQAGGPTGTARASAPGSVPLRLARGILVPALALASLGATAAALPGHGIRGHVHASSHQAARSKTVRLGAGKTKSCKVYDPWMFGTNSPAGTGTGTSDPWMFGTNSGSGTGTGTSDPWMFGVAKMYAAVSQPWMFEPKTAPDQRKCSTAAASVGSEAHLARKA